ncbi:MAG TPA: ABC transporter substrate-binding protein [Vicinamibacterales bacterium]|nr:ABC transporter substrate-binding protein [Vicinamibacterales bacterium]
MALPTYKTALVTYPHTQPLKDGTVVPRTFRFEFEDVPVIIKAFRRMVRGLEFDISEMAITTYLTAKAHGKRFTAIPVFPMRAFHHGAILYNPKSGIRTPRDLEGKRVGVNRGYTVTTGLWARSILQHEYGVDLSKVTWVLSGDEHVAEYRPPANVVSIEEGRTLEQMLLSGDIAAANGVQTDSPDIKPLIPNAKEAGLNRLRAGGLYPINHTVVVKDDRLAAHPELAADLFDAFVRAKQIYVDRLKSGAIADPTAMDKTFASVMEITGDPLPYGVAPNRREIEAVIQYSVEQGILRKPFGIEEVFAKGTLDLVG